MILSFSFPRGEVRVVYFFIIEVLGKIIGDYNYYYSLSSFEIAF